MTRPRLFTAFRGVRRTVVDVAPSGVSILLAVIVGLVQLTASRPVGASPPVDSNGPVAQRISRNAKVGPGIVEGLAVAGFVRVVVGLALPARPTPPPPDAAEGRRDAFLQELSASVQRLQSDVLARTPGEELTVLRRFQTVPALVGIASATGIERLAGLPEVVRIDLDTPGQGTGTGVLVEAKDLTNADDVNELGITGEGITVAVLDSGLDRDHPDLQDDLVDEACFCSDTPEREGACCPNAAATQTGAGAAEDDHGHGSLVTGIITSKGTVAAAGVAPDAEIVAVKVLDADKLFLSSDVVAGLDWVVANHPSDVDVVNMSLGTFATFSGECDDATASTMAFRDVIESLHDLGIVTFAASMDGGSATQMPAPACIQKAVAVGAVDDSDVPTVFSNSNSVTDLFAPGETIESTFLAGSKSEATGTSMASPHAAACAANILHAGGKLPPAEIEARLEATGVSVVDPKNSLTFPRIDCLAALPKLRLWIATLIGR